MPSAFGGNWIVPATDDISARFADNRLSSAASAGALPAEKCQPSNPSRTFSAMPPISEQITGR